MAKTQTVQDARRDDGAGAASGRAADAPPPTPAEALETLAQALAATAVERDRQGGHAARERELIRQSGLLRLSVPTAHGGAGASWSTVLGAVRRLAQADSALAHVFGFHHLQVAGCCSTARPSSMPTSWNRPWRATCSGAMRSIRWTAAWSRAPSWTAIASTVSRASARARWARTC